MNRKTKTKRILTLLLAAALLTSLSACNGQTVSALDYALENQIYTEQVVPAETLPAEVDQADNPSEPPLPEDTMLPEESPLPEDAPENTEGESAVFLYTLRVSDQDGVPLPNVRVTLYADDALLYSAMTDADGRAAWTIPTGCVYTAKAELDGYAEQENRSQVSDNQADVPADIILCVIAQPSAEPTDEPAAAETPSPSPSASTSPIPVPATESGKVTITAGDVSVQAGDTGFSLLDGVTAVNEAGGEAAVWIVNDGGFSINVPGGYAVSYAAMQGNAIVSASRTVTVTGNATEEPEEAGIKASAPSGSSNERYQQLLAYRNEIYGELASRMQALSSGLDAVIQELTAGEANVRLMKETPLLEDDSELEDARDMDGRKIETMGFTQVQQVSVSNWPDILAVFIAKSSLDIDDPLDLMELRNISLDGLDEVFWDMVKISVLQTDDGMDVLPYSKSYAEMADEYNLSANRKDLLYELMQPEFQRVFASLTGDTAFDDLTDAEIQAALSQLPEGLPVKRESVVSTACSLAGKVTYFWGGKYDELGWNPGWGLPRIVTSEGSKTTGTERAYGLDCSGFVSWTFINATGDASVLDVIGNGSSDQWVKSSSIGWDAGQPGDLAFLAAPGERNFNHVGIIVSVEEDGSYLVAHCSSSQNGVVVTEAWSSGFRYLRRPILFQDE